MCLDKNYKKLILIKFKLKRIKKNPLDYILTLDRLRTKNIMSD